MQHIFTVNAKIVSEIHVAADPEIGSDD